MGSQRVDMTELLNWTDEQSTNISCKLHIYFIILHKYIKKHIESSSQVWHKLLTNKSIFNFYIFLFFYCASYVLWEVIGLEIQTISLKIWSLCIHKTCIWNQRQRVVPLGLHDKTLGRFSNQNKKIEEIIQRKITPLICMFLI